MKRRLYPAYQVHIVIFLAFLITGFIMNSPSEIIGGIKSIILNSDILITDYVEIAGVGPTLVNSGLLSLMIIAFYIYHGIKPNGSTIMSIWLTAGFAFFGKNILNIWPVILGVWLYSKYKKESFINYILIAVLGTTLSPAVSQLSFQNIFPINIGVLIGVIIGIFIGFILPPLASSCIKIHQGYNLYNIGFAGGLIAMILMSLYRILGIEFEKRFIWNTGNNLFFSIFLLGISLFLIIYGIINNGKSLKNLKAIHGHTGRLISDYFLLYDNAAFINMGILGIFSTLYVIVVGGDLNGPTISGIFSIIGFGAFGKHLFNIIPVMIGAILSAFLNIWQLNSPNMLLTTLFSTGLAPIAGQFGWPIGILAGFLHVAVAMNIGYLHGGLNLYNNGFAAGFVAMILVPIIRGFGKGE
ncbi:Protein of unknown function [Clostridium amylolyticum]|uniref:DUF1576 domain-containing protein n=1 Tax=Clostridium amylolyticum TaxID=1121298 RepID=A0A1M6PAK8_9CLOT|nr:DUF1576 domain-containing protein [Clostridium amylolyticum]SHK04985.1 Protein of unknown function [Clostridium amylolyticum]